MLHCRRPATSDAHAHIAPHFGAISGVQNRFALAALSFESEFSTKRRLCKSADSSSSSSELRLVLQTTRPSSRAGTCGFSSLTVCTPSSLQYATLCGVLNTKTSNRFCSKPTKIPIPATVSVQNLNTSNRSIPATGVRRSPANSTLQQTRVSCERVRTFSRATPSSPHSTGICLPTILCLFHIAILFAL